MQTRNIPAGETIFSEGDAALLEPGENEIVAGPPPASFAPAPAPYRFKVVVEDE